MAMERLKSINKYPRQWDSDSGRPLSNIFSTIAKIRQELPPPASYTAARFSWWDKWDVKLFMEEMETLRSELAGTAEYNLRSYLDILYLAVVLLALAALVPWLLLGTLTHGASFPSSPIC